MNTIHRVIPSYTQSIAEVSLGKNVRVGRIELPSRPWQGRILPLNHTRISLFNRASIRHFTFYFHRVLPEGFEPPTTVPKTGMISISLRERTSYNTAL
jgi:hypothetical protein